MEELNNILASLQLDEFSSAKIKIDQLFFEWLALEGHAVIDAIISAEDLVNSDDEGIVSSRSSESLSSTGAGGAAVASGPGPIPPRSPTNAKKSPKKRTQAEMQSTTNQKTGSGTTSSLIENSVLSSAEGVPLAGGDKGDRAQNNSFVKEEIEKDNEDEVQISARRRSNFDRIPLFYVPGGCRQKDPKLRVRQGMWEDSL